MVPESTLTVVPHHTSVRSTSSSNTAPFLTWAPKLGQHILVGPGVVFCFLSVTF